MLHAPTERDKGGFVVTEQPSILKGKGYCWSFCFWFMELLWVMIFFRPAVQWLASLSELAMRSRFFRWSLKMIEKQRFSGTSWAYFSIPSVL